MSDEEDDDDDDDDLWADFSDEDTTTIHVSENLAHEVDMVQPVVHQGDVDEGKLTWEGPAVAGLHNSVKVNEAKNKHWYAGDEESRSRRASKPTGSWRSRYGARSRR